MQFDGRDGCRMSVSRQMGLLPALSKSPFENDEDGGQTTKQNAESEMPPLTSPWASSSTHVKQLKTYPSENIWTSLLLDIAMTTAFKSLSNGVRILTFSDVLSYSTFFLLVWLIYAGQTAYDLRYRKADCVHFLFAFLQFVVFCSMATFASKFNIESSLSSTTANTMQFMLNSTTPSQILDVEADTFRNNHRLVINAKGISFVMGLNRLFLLLEYGVVFIYATKRAMGQHDKSKILGTIFNVQKDLTFFHVQMLSLLLQAAWFFIAFYVSGEDIALVSAGDQIAKVVLWYLPLLMEFAFHLFYPSLAGSTPVKPSKIFKRSAITFTVVIGGGLDHIIQGLQYILGTSIPMTIVAGTLISASLVFVVQFVIYFGTERDHIQDEQHCRCRNFAWTILHLLYVTTVHLLEATTSLLTSVNILYALELPSRFIERSEALLLKFGANATLNASAFQYNDLNISHQLEEFGLALQDYLTIANAGLANTSGLANGAASKNAFAENYVYMTSQNAVLQAGMLMLENILSTFGANPEPNSLLGTQIQVFIGANTSDFTHANTTIFTHIFQQLLLLNTSSILLFYGSGGLSIIILAILRVIKQWPLENYDLALLLCRVTFGLAIALLTLLDIGSLTNMITIGEQGEIQFASSPFWRLIGTSWTLPVLALALVAEQITEFAILYIVGRLPKDTVRLPCIEVANQRGSQIPPDLTKSV